MCSACLSAPIKQQQADLRRQQANIGRMFAAERGYVQADPQQRQADLDRKLAEDLAAAEVYRQGVAARWLQVSSAVALEMTD